MALMQTYLITTKNVTDFFNALIGAQAPEKFNYKFLQSLDFTSTNDRLFVGILKGLAFIDDAGVPTQRYYDFLDQSQSGIILAEAIKESYSDLFAVNKKANELTLEEAKNKLRTLTQGQKSDKVLLLMTNTFRALCDYADWTQARQIKDTPLKDEEKAETTKDETTGTTKAHKTFSSQLHYNIQIHLPESRDPAVYEVLFRALKEHLFIKE
jgi:hypothetical protein